MWKSWRPKGARTIWMKKNKVGEQTLPDFQTYNKGKLIKTV